MLARLSRDIYRSPGAKTAIPIALALGIGIFSNFLVTEMTVSGRIEWLSFYKTVSFYLLLAFSAATYVFHRNLYIYETDVFRFKEPEYCVAYARSQLIPAHIDAAKAQIASGDKDQFEAAMAQVKKILK